MDFIVHFCVMSKFLFTFTDIEHLYDLSVALCFVAISEKIVENKLINF